jgi:nucleoside 2-deoxyribosyltransferase
VVPLNTRSFTKVGKAGSMNVYFSCSLTGGRNDEAIYAAIVEHLHANGHEVPTAHLAMPEVMDLERVVEPGEVFQRDIAWIQACDALIAEVSTPSHGVGYEIAYALNLGKPALCCHRQGVPVSKMLTGNDAACLSVMAYANLAEVLAIVDTFLGEVHLR